MNAILAFATSQITTARNDLRTLQQTPLTKNTISKRAEITVTLGNLQKCISQLEDLYSKEINEEAKKNLDDKISKIKQQHTQFRSQFEDYKSRIDTNIALEETRNELFNRGARSRVGGASSGMYGSSSSAISENPYSTKMSYEQGMHNERKNLGRASQQLDDILEMGHRGLEDLVSQNKYFQKFEEKLIGGLETLGVSQLTIKKVEKRAYEDRFIFFGGALFMFVCFYLILKYLR